MEDAGYGPDNKYELTINSYQGIFTEMVRGVRDKLSAAHIDATIEPTEFATIIEKGKQGTLQCYTLGWIADWPSPDNFVRLMAPQYTDIAELGDSALTYTNWSELDTDAKQQADEAWSTISGNLEPSDDAQQARNEAYVSIEEANWEDVVLINLRPRGNRAVLLGQHRRRTVRWDGHLAPDPLHYLERVVPSPDHSRSEARPLRLSGAVRCGQTTSDRSGYVPRSISEIMMIPGHTAGAAIQFIYE